MIGIKDRSEWRPEWVSRQCYQTADNIGQEPAIFSADILGLIASTL